MIMSEIETVKLAESNTLLPNLTICVEKDEFLDDTLPQIEYFDTDKVKIENVEDQMETDVKMDLEFSRKKMYENKRLQSLKDLGLTPEEAEKKKSERAKRFEAELPEESLNQSKERSSKIEEMSERLKKNISGYNAILMENDPKYIRDDALFLQGVDHMNTDQIYSFFGDLNPSNIEWLNDASCNVVWYDKKNVIPAFVAVTFSEIALEESDSKMDITSEKVESNDSQVFENVLMSCTKHDKNQNLKIRLAETGDVKVLGAGKRSKFYRKYGNPHFGGAKGILTSTYKKRFQKKRTMDELESLNVFVHKKPRQNENVSEIVMSDIENEDSHLLSTSAKDLHDAIPFSQKEERYTTMVADTVSDIIDKAKYQSSITKTGDDLRITKSSSNILSRLGKKVEKPSTDDRDTSVLDRLPSSLRRRLGKKVDHTKHRNRASEHHDRKNDNPAKMKHVAREPRVDSRKMVEGSRTFDHSDSDSDSLDLN